MQARKKIVAITGPFSDVNFGDYAMLINNIYDLHIKDILLFVYDKEFLNIIEGDYLSKYNIKTVNINIRDSWKTLFTEHYIPTPFELISLIDNYDNVAEEIANIDVLIVNGGGYFNSLWSMPHRIERLLKIISPIIVANQLDKRIFFTGNSFGPFGEDAAFFTCLFSVLKNVTFCCRDNLFSPVWLKQLGVSDLSIKYVPDDLLFVNKNLLNFKTKNSIESKNYIVMESYLPIDYFKENIEGFINFSKIMYDRYNLNIVFLPFHLGHGGFNQANYLNNVLDHYEYYDISLEGYLPIQDAIRIIKESNLVISTRYHALVLALGCGIPVINVLKEVVGDMRYYYNKSFGILRGLFEGIPFDERVFLKSNYLEALTYIENNYNSIIEYQKIKYDNEQYLVNRNKLMSIRTEYLSKISNEVKSDVRQL